MQEVAVLGVGLHRFGKTGDDIVGNKSVTELCRHAVDHGAGTPVCPGSRSRPYAPPARGSRAARAGDSTATTWSRIIGSTGIPVYNMSAGCAAGGNAFNVGYAMVAGGVYDMVLVVGGEVMPKGMIQTSGVEEVTDPEFLRQRCVGMPGPSFWATLARRRMHEIRHHRGAVCTGHGQGTQVFGRQPVCTLPEGNQPAGRAGFAIRQQPAAPVRDLPGVERRCSGGDLLDGRRQSSSPAIRFWSPRVRSQR
jgi:hypothetical protein